MEYTFTFVGITPILTFFNHQLYHSTAEKPKGAAYLASDRCTLDAFLESVETVPSERNWNLDQVVDSVISFWLNHGEQVRHWKQRLEEAGSENLLVARVADFRALKVEFEALFGQR